MSKKASSSREIEIKVKVQNGKKLISFLSQKAKFISHQTQKDEYFVPVHRNFTAQNPIKEWFRIRIENDSCSLNYKFWHFESDGKARMADEYETQVSDPVQLRKILDSLNFKSVVFVDKTRTSWMYKDYEVAIDSVKKLGEFVEIEYKGKNTSSKTAKEITQEMVDFLTKLNCGKISRNFQGYPFLLLFPQKAEFEAV